jgi:hypothetical protein
LIRPIDPIHQAEEPMKNRPASEPVKIRDIEPGATAYVERAAIHELGDAKYYSRSGAFYIALSREAKASPEGVFSLPVRLRKEGACFDLDLTGGGVAAAFQVTPSPEIERGGVAASRDMMADAECSFAPILVRRPVPAS